jgi:penicillin-binding protein 1A
LKKFLKYICVLFLGSTLIAILVASLLSLHLISQLPSIEQLSDVQLQVPLRIYSADKQLMAEFGEKRRSPIDFHEVPHRLIQAILAAEDDRFFEHPGVDYQGLLRAAMHLVTTGTKGQGGSTITMQVARNFFLSSEKTYTRKLNEIFLALKIEQSLSKEQILELYLNKIYLGNRAYGIVAAAQVYYGKSVADLSLPEIAMIAGLPKAPSRYNPIANPKRATLRRNYVLRRMQDLGYIDAHSLLELSKTPVTAAFHGPAIALSAPYASEWARTQIIERYGKNVYTQGFEVITTIDSRLQQIAGRVLQNNLLAYDRRHGYRGPLKQVAPTSTMDERLEVLAQTDGPADLIPALVLNVTPELATLVTKRNVEMQLSLKAVEWARPYISENKRGPKPTSVDQVLSAGDLIFVQKDHEDTWQLSQIPKIEGALIALDPNNGQVLALVGGFDFYSSNFNRAIQAKRQPGSAFKPFIYSAALEKNYTPASIINDAPVVFRDPGLEAAWRPENYSGKFSGPIRLREALAKSRNLVSIRLLRSIGVPFAIKHAAQFGFDVHNLPRDLSLALGSGAVSPLEIARGYAVFANGGYLIDPYLLHTISTPQGDILYEANPATVCDHHLCAPSPIDTQLPEFTELQNFAPIESKHRQTSEIKQARSVLSSQNAYLIYSMLQGVIRNGTAQKARQLGRSDLAGKTGTTNDQQDAWFSGFNRNLVTTTWIGFDQPKPLGSRETGSGAALPIWIDFMREALDGVPEAKLPRPTGIVSVRIDPQTGLLAYPGQSNAIFEEFRTNNAPTQQASEAEFSIGDDPGNRQPLF